MDQIFKRIQNCAMENRKLLEKIVLVKLNVYVEACN